MILSIFAFGVGVLLYIVTLFLRWKNDDDDGWDWLALISFLIMFIAFYAAIIQAEKD